MNDLVTCFANVKRLTALRVNGFALTEPADFFIRTHLPAAVIQLGSNIAAMEINNLGISPFAWASTIPLNRSSRSSSADSSHRHMLATSRPDADVRH